MNTPPSQLNPTTMMTPIPSASAFATLQTETVGNDYLRWPEVFKLAVICDTGAVNPLAVVNGLHEAIEKDKMPREILKDHLFIKIIIGQLSYLLNESLGPRQETVDEFKVYIAAIHHKSEDWSVAQYLSAIRTCERWKVPFIPSEWNFLPLEKCLMKPFGVGEPKLYIGIERDGYTHS